MAEAGLVVEETQGTGEQVTPESEGTTQDYLNDLFADVEEEVAEPAQATNEEPGTEEAPTTGEETETQAQTKDPDTLQSLDDLAEHLNVKPDELLDLQYEGSSIRDRLEQANRDSYMARQAEPIIDEQVRLQVNRGAEAIADTLPMFDEVFDYFMGGMQNAMSQIDPNAPDAAAQRQQLENVRQLIEDGKLRVRDALSDKIRGLLQPMTNEQLQDARNARLKESVDQYYKNTGDVWTDAHTQRLARGANLALGLTKQDLADPDAFAILTRPRVAERLLKIEAILSALNKGKGTLASGKRGVKLNSGSRIQGGRRVVGQPVSGEGSDRLIEEAIKNPDNKSLRGQIIDAAFDEELAGG